MKRGQVFLRTGAGLLLAVTAACSLTTSFDGFVGSSDPADGGPSNNDGDSTAPGVDGSNATEDGAVTPNDGGSEADAPDPNTPPVFIDGGSFCSGQTTATFCDDFDKAPLAINWTREGAFAKQTSYQPSSAPNVFLVDAPASTSGGTFFAKITRPFETASTNLLIAFDIKQERVDVGTAALIMSAVEWTRGTKKYSIRLVYTAGSIRLEESDIEHPGDDVKHGTFTLDNKWTRVGLDIVASGGTPTMKITVDGIAAAGLEAVALLPPVSGRDDRPTLILGAVFATNPHNGWTLRYDNVTVTNR